jgi:hypothetical protein
MGMTTVDGVSPEFKSWCDDALARVIARAEIDLRLSRNNPERMRRVGAVMDAALAERERRLRARFAKPS